MNRLKRNIIYFTAGIGLVFVWRGVWGLLDEFFLPDNRILSLILSVFIGIFILIIDDLELKELRTRELTNEKEKKEK